MTPSDTMQVMTKKEWDLLKEDVATACVHLGCAIVMVFCVGVMVLAEACMHVDAKVRCKLKKP